MNLKEKMLSGKKILGTMLRVVRNPGICCFAKHAGLDFVMFDCEHGNYNFETLHDAFITANALGISGFIRVPVGTKDYISRALDAGAGGIMVPMVETVEQAETLSYFSKFHPVGNRGFNSMGAHTDYKGGKHSDIMKEANDRIIAITQIETKQAIDNIDAIAAVPGIDAMLIGPNDLSISLGVPGDLMNPIELDAIAKVAAACQKHGKAFGLHAGADLLKKFAKELRLVMCMGDTDFLKQGMTGVRKVFDEL